MSAVPNPLLDALSHDASVVGVELRPPRAELDAAAGMDAWIDTHHAVRGLVRANTFVFLTDSAVGAREEHNLRHLVSNLGADVRRDYVIPFLTSKHTLQFCLSYAERAWQEGFQSLVVLGGDQSVGAPRCVEHAWQLRREIRRHVPGLTLGGWANPHADPAAQTGFLTDAEFSGDFFLTQIVSHHDAERIDRFLDAYERRRLTLPGMFGVFYYRSATPRTLETLRRFLPVPIEALKREFADGATPEEVCARTVRLLRSAGARHLYISNLPIGRAKPTLAKILALAQEEPEEARL
jgi:5,10-methylenetetrahydrofolate reductase